MDIGGEDGLQRPFWKAGPRTLGAARRLLDLVLPPRTLDGDAQAQSGGLTGEGWSRIAFIAEPACDGCGAPFEHDQTLPGAEAARCAACLARPRAFARARAACLYDDASRDLILQFKRADRTDLARLFARWLSRSAAPLLADCDVVVPVPLHPTRLLARRYNQAAEMARPLAALTGLAYRPDALVRRRATQTQGGKSKSGRRRNVAGAFATPAGRAGQVAGKRVLLVDDVLTTGATAEGCARALLAAGAAQVNLVVVARVKEASSGAI